MNEGGLKFSIGVTGSGTQVHSAPASLVACLDDAFFRSVVSGQIPNDGNMPPYSFTPIWNGEDPPTVAALELKFGDAPTIRYDAEVLAPQARAHIQNLVKDGVLKSDESVRWHLSAHETLDTEVAPQQFSVRVLQSPLPLEPAELPGAIPGEFSVEFQDRVLSELSDEVAAANAVERAWLLVGSVCHDRRRKAAELRVQGTVPVEVGPGGASQHHFAFDPAAFVAARRNACSTETGAICVGWAHSHPPCVGCRTTPSCQADTRFFSTDDVAVHSSAFTSPFTVGLVVGKVGHRPATQLGFRLYGWEGAQIRERDYRVWEG